MSGTSTSQNQQDTLIIAENAEPRFFTMLPNLVDDLPLSTVAFRLYAHYKRVTGEGDGGACWESSERICKRLCISKSTLTRARKELEKWGLVSSEKRSFHGEFPSVVVKVKNIWTANNAVYENLNLLDSKEEKKAYLSYIQEGDVQSAMAIVDYVVNRETT
ncbi:MAG: helix-turn-helix domain-containing protein [Anaerolineaceae bacterium]|nr:helix-turn-helix domain-containing protein [Anaerolineaceae bacterium]